jgi:hypothetical protein
MYKNYSKDERKEELITKYGEHKYFETLNLLEHESGVLLTHKTVMPNFLQHAVEELKRKSV